MLFQTKFLKSWIGWLLKLLCSFGPFHCKTMFALKTIDVIPIDHLMWGPSLTVIYWRRKTKRTARICLLTSPCAKGQLASENHFLYLFLYWEVWEVIRKGKELSGTGTWQPDRMGSDGSSNDDPVKARLPSIVKHTASGENGDGCIGCRCQTDTRPDSAFPFDVAQRTPGTNDLYKGHRFGCNCTKCHSLSCALHDTCRQPSTWMRPLMQTPFLLYQLPFFFFAFGHIKIIINYIFLKSWSFKLTAAKLQYFKYYIFFFNTATL